MATYRKTADAQARLTALNEERARLAAALEASEARFKAIIERNADAIVVVDPRGVVRYANAMAERLFGRTRDELIGSELGHPLVSGETTELDLPANGDSRVLEMRVVESDWEDSPTLLASLRDVTERKLAEESQRRLIREQAARAAAEEAVRLKTDFLAVVSHDLRTPLTAIIGYAELMAMGVPEPLGEVSRHHTDRIRTAARHVLYLLDELLAFARLDLGRDEVHVEEVVLQDVAREVAEVVENLAGDKGLRFVLDLPPDPLTLRTDRGKLRQVLLNLAGNAVKYTPEGEVGISLREIEGGLALEVRDTGIGIEPTHLDQIFQPFWQVQRSSDNGGGAGIGLSVVRRLVAMLGGKVSVKSTPGDGSTFTVALPRPVPANAGA